jgi:predicted transcriptional regulator
MEQAIIPLPNRRRLNAQDRALRRKRIFARLREGSAYDEIAREERLTAERVREIVGEVLQKRRVDVGPAHALLQLDRLAAPLRVASESVASGDVKAIPSLLKTLKAIDAYQKLAQVSEVHDDEIREKLLAKINRLAEAFEREKAEKSAAMVQAAREAWGEIPPATAGEASTAGTAAAGPAEAAAAEPAAARPVVENAGSNVPAGPKYTW